MKQVFTKLTSLAIAAACLALLCATPVSLRAATITVTTTADSGPGSLREALASAANSDTIAATGVAGTITLTSGQLTVSNSLTIIGPGPDTLTVSGNYTSRVFEVTGTNVTIRGLTIANAQCALDGAAINAGSSSGSVVNVSDCLVTNNSTTRAGGGIFNNFGITMTISNCIISGNSATGSGGGLFNSNATMTVIASTLSGNTANIGGGILNHARYSVATLTISASTLSSNSANYGSAIYSGGRYVGPAAVTIVNSTFSDNSGHEDINIDGAWSEGNATVTINASTFSRQSGVGIYNDGQGGGYASLDIGNTIFNAGPSASANLANLGGPITSHGYNLSSDDGGGFLTNTTDQVSTDPLLGPLQDNGGPTLTHALLPGSPALDKGKRDAIPALASDTDQRGFPRPSDNPDLANATGGDGSDIGAFETPLDLTVTKLQAKVNFNLAKPNTDSAKLTATLDPGPGFSVSNKVVTVDIGGAQVSFTLDAKGRGISGSHTCKLSYKKNTGLWTVTVSLKNGSWATEWEAHGLENVTTPKAGVAVSLPVTLLIGDDAFADEKSLLYKATAGKSGSAK